MSNTDMYILQAVAKITIENYVGERTRLYINVNPERSQRTQFLQLIRKMGCTNCFETIRKKEKWLTNISRRGRMKEFRYITV